MEKTYIKDFNISDLVPYDKNPRDNTKAVGFVVKSIKRNGNIDPIEVDENHVILAGHTRRLALIKMGIDKTDIIRVDGLTEKQKKTYRIESNKTNEHAEWKDFLGEIELDDAIDMGFEIPDLDEEKEIIEDEAPSVSSNPPVSKEGDVWLLGDHRLMCGDSTDAGTVALLMDGEKADMVFTDPPYGIKIKNKNGEIKGDENLDVFEGCMECINMFSKETSHRYIYFGVQFLKECYEIISKYMPTTNLLPQRIVHENKPSPEFMFKNNFELCCFSNPKKTLFNKDIDKVSESTLKDSRYNGNGFSDTYKALNEIRSTEHNLKAIHPTQKSIEICSYYQKISSCAGQSVLDLFGGSGSTLIACEQLDRKCYMMELDPKYCDVIIKRWESLTGKDAARECDGVKFKEL